MADIEDCGSQISKEKKKHIVSKLFELETWSKSLTVVFRDQN